MHTNIADLYGLSLFSDNNFGILVAVLLCIQEAQDSTYNHIQLW